jgi:hypothetical protein
MVELPFDENDSFEVVHLSTRITQIENKMLQEIGGWLQTGNKTATIRKQEVVRHTIRMAYEYLCTQLDGIDSHSADISPTPKTTPHNLPTNVSRTINLDLYHEIANKPTTGTLHKPNFLK